MWNMILAGTPATRAGVGEEKDEGKADKMTFKFPLDFTIKNSMCMLERTSGKWLQPLFVFTLPSFKSALWQKSWDILSRLVLTIPHTYSCSDGFASQRLVGWHTMASMLPALQISSRNCLLSGRFLTGTNPFKKRRAYLPFLDRNEKWVEQGKKPRSVCGFLLALPGIFTLIEQALETLNTHQSRAFSASTTSSW